MHESIITPLSPRCLLLPRSAMLLPSPLAATLLLTGRLASPTATVAATASYSLPFLQDQGLRDATRISSVYFDNPQLVVYHSRLARGDGSSLVRVRWYGNRQPGNPDQVCAPVASFYAYACCCVPEPAFSSGMALAAISACAMQPLHS